MTGFPDMARESSRVIPGPSSASSAMEPGIHVFLADWEESWIPDRRFAASGMTDETSHSVEHGCGDSVIDSRFQT